MRGIWTPLPWWRSLDAHHKTAYSTLALALVTLPLAAATVLLAFLNRAILNEMRAGERPIVWLSNVRSQPFFVPATVPSDKGRIFWDFGWTNFGKSPAVEVQFTRTILTGIESFKMPPLASGAPIAPTQYDQTRANSQSDLSQTDFETLMRTNDEGSSRCPR